MKFTKLTFCFATCAVMASLSAAPAQKIDEAKLLAEGRKLENARKIKEAKVYYQECLKKDISSGTRRLILNRCAMFTGGKEQQEYLMKACMLKGANPSETYRTYMLLGFTMQRSAPDKALGYFLNFGNKKQIHPGLVYTGYICAGQIMEKKKKYTQALEYYREALAAGKAVTYKFNYSAAEKGIARMEQLIKAEGSKK